jgi:hypothetical protein
VAWLIVTAAVIGIVSGRLRRPHPAHRRPPAVRHPDLLLFGLITQVASWLTPGAPGAVILGLSLAALLIALAGNLDVVGFGVMSVGIALNLLGLMLNLGVPADRDALVSANVVEAAELDTVTLTGGRHVQADDLVPILGDVVPVGLLGAVLSFGDLILLAGLIATTSDACRKTQRRQAISTASVDQDWGMAPSPAPVSAFQNSAKPETATPETIDLASPRLIFIDDFAEDPDLVSASQSR